ncbi:hypothetical protein [Sorangium sp. So ce1151]|uniref:hypothetical protein n=1 Tax=Sorangium sp. So ce1151 TaxID=3133332 RepID=UPI003F62D029
MKSLKSRVLSGVGAALVALSLSAPALASWDAPAKLDCPDYTTAAAGLVAVAAQLTDTLDLNDEVINAEHIKIVYLQDVLNDAEIDIVDDTLNNLVLNLQILNLQNVLKDVDVANGIKIGDVLSNNDVDVSDVVGVKVFDVNGIKKLLVFVK